MLARTLRSSVVVVAAVVAGGGCSTLGDAFDQIGWQTRHDATKQTRDLSVSIADTQKSVHGGLEALADGDKEKLRKLGEAAVAAAQSKIDGLDSQIKRQENAWKELEQGVLGLAVSAIPGVGGTLNSVIGSLKQITTNTATTARDAADKANSTAEAQGRTDSRVGRVESRVDRLDAATSDALEKMKTILAPDTMAKLERVTKSDLDALADLKQDRTKFDQRVAEVLAARGVSREEIVKFQEQTKGLSTEQILALILTIAGGGTVGTVGARTLSGSGRRIDGLQKESSDLYDGHTKNAERLARLEAQVADLNVRRSRRLRGSGGAGAGSGGGGGA